MLIHYLEFNNFLPFYGKHRIDFPVQTNPHQPFTLILSPTNTGKTTTIRALRFLLYGNFGDASIDPKHTLINHEAKRQCQPSSEVECWVRAKITFGPDKEFWFQRRVTASRNGQGMEGFTLRSCELERIREGRTGTSPVPDDGTIKSAIKRFAPELLFNLFIFAGEPGEGRIDPTKPEIGLDAELKEIFRLSAWDSARDQLLKVKASFEAALSSRQANSQDANAAWAKYETEKNRAEQWELKIRTASERIMELDALIEAAVDKFAKVGPKGQEAENLKKAYDQAEADRQTTITKIQRCQAEMVEAIASSRGKVWLTHAFDSVAKLLPQKEPVPAQVPLETLRKLLQDELCICDRPLDHQCTGSRDAIEKLIGRLQGSDGSEQISFMRRILGVDSSGTWKGEAFKAQDIIRSGLPELNRLTLSERDLKTQVQKLESKIDEASVNAARAARLELTQLKNEFAQMTGAKNKAELELAAQKSQVKYAKADYDRKRQSLPREQRDFAEQTERNISRVEKLISLLDETRNELRTHLRKGLQEKLSNNYDYAAADGSKAVVGATLVPQIQLNGVRVTAIGGAQKQMLELGYVVALAEVYYEISQAFKHYGLALNASPDLAIVADAPFSNTADTYNNQIIDFLSKCSARQKILLMHKTQWEAVKERLEPLVSTVYGYKLHSPNPPSDEDEYCLNIKGQNVRLLEHANADNHPRSQITKIFPYAD